MRQFDNYVQFCKAFRSEEDELKKDAILLLFIQNWIIRILDYMEESTLDFSLNKLLEQTANKKSNNYRLKDSLSNIVDDSVLAFRYLSENMREKIIRENVKMPVYKVKEINSYGLNWLSRQSGKTIRQKISSSRNSIMAVQRRLSFDTAENRLFLAFSKEIYEHLNTKLESLSENDQRTFDIEENMHNELSNFLRCEEIKEVQRWDNLPPNNTLLSDQNYKKIWHAWSKLKKIDARIKNDSNYIESRLATIFFIELLVYFKDTLRIPQEPVEVDYDEYNVYICDKQLFCLDGEGNTVILIKKDNLISLKSSRIDIDIQFISNNILIRTGQEEEKKYRVTRERIYLYIKLIATKLGLKKIRQNNIKEIGTTKKFNSIVIDLFSLHPGYIGDDLVYRKLSERILQQKYIANTIDGEKNDYYLPCDRPNSIKMIPDITDTYTIPFAVDNGSMEQMKRLVYMMESYIETNSFTYVFPDAYNELQISMIHKVVRMVYRRVRNIPFSIGAAFKYQTTELFKSNFKIGDFLLIVNLIDDEVTFTLVSSIYDKKVKSDFSYYNGIVWERHPTSTVSFKNIIDNNFVNLLIKRGCIEAEKVYKLFGLDGLKDEVDNLSINFGNEWFEVTSEVRELVDQFKLNITDAISDFLMRNSSVVKNFNIHILSLVDNIVYKGTIPFSYISKQEVLEGCKELERLEELTNIPLWHDHLPALAIKLMYGKFDLIRNARVVPRFDEKQRIPIIGTFILPKNRKEYHFNLVQDENARKMQYEAVIKSSAFPLNNDEECNLLMTYQYGAEDPYELIFVPKNSNDAGFSEVKVKWSRLEKYNSKGLKAPDFPRKISWKDLECYPGRNGDIINVFHVLEDEFNILNEGYYTFDISDTLITSNVNGKLYGEFFFNKNDEIKKVKWQENDWDRDTVIPDNISVISCWIVPDIAREDKRKSTRYRISDLRAARTRDNLWFKNKNGDMQCIVYFEYKGEEKTIVIIDKYFENPNKFNTSINDISFEIREFSNGGLQAINIRVIDETDIKPSFKAINICEGHTVPVPPRFFTNSYYGKWTRILFANNRSISERECPLAFQRCFTKSVNNWVNLFYQYREPHDKKELFTLLSLAAKDIGKEYYEIAYKLLDMYKYGKLDIPYEIGCAFCDLSNNMQRELLEFIIDEVAEDYKIIGILAKALWHNEQFVYNVDLDLLLNIYLPKAIDYIGDSLCRSNGKRILRDDLENVKYCLEYILGVMRLRNLNDVIINDKYLSLNNYKMKELYKYLEIMVDNNTKIHSFLKLNITTKGEYNKICDLLYTLLVYVTGNDIEGEIRISLNLDD